MAAEPASGSRRESINSWPFVDTIPGRATDALLPVLKRDRNASYGTPPSLCAASLDTALVKVAAAAVAKRASVHSPRPAAAAGGGSWYAAERLLRKRLEEAYTFVYYFRRR